MSPTTVPPAWLNSTLYPFTHRTCALSAGRLHYVDEGTGEPVVFVHGTPSWSFEFRRLIERLRDRHRCIAPDLLGFGLSDRPSAFAYTPEAHAAVLREFVDALGLTRFTLVVHDFGGPIALPLALDGRVSRLVVLNSWMWPIDEPAARRQARLIGGVAGRWLYEYANFSLRVLMPMAFRRRAALSPEVHAHYLAPFRDRAARGRVLHALARALMASEAHYRRLFEGRGALAAVPTLFVWGIDDPVFGRSYLAKWQRALPHARTVEIPAGHWPHEEQPDQVVQALEVFL